MMKLPDRAPDYVHYYPGEVDDNHVIKFWFSEAYAEWPHWTRKGSVIRKIYWCDERQILVFERLSSEQTVNDTFCLSIQLYYRKWVAENALLS